MTDQESEPPACDGPWTPRLALTGLGLAAPTALLTWQILRTSGAGYGAVLSLAIGLLFGLGVVGHAALLHLAGHKGEARRLGLPLKFDFFPRPRLRLSAGASARERERWRTESTLVRIAGAWANERISKLGIKDVTLWMMPFIISMTLTFTLPLGSLGARTVLVLQAASLVVAAVSLGLFAVHHANELVALAARAELFDRPAFYPREFRSWPFWAHRDQRNKLDQRRYRRDHRLILKAAGLRGDLTVLELGSGGSVLWGHLPRPRTRGWTQVDMDLAALFTARSRGTGRRWVCADANNLPFADAAADMVVTLGLFDSLVVEQTETILAEVRRVLKPGGLLVHMQDFFDWPGPDLAPQFNEVLSGAGRAERVLYNPLTKELEYPAIEGSRQRAVLGALRQADRALPPIMRDRAAFLERLLASPQGPGDKHRKPNEAFKLVFKETLERCGFHVVSIGDELRKHLYHSSYLIAKKKG